ncbi:hypothetical protein BGX24_010616 [Mortierella sp. AD032]|nr:hypothetical protein BGX24_010616 [Mortierella sp. AD032]
MESGFAGAWTNARKTMLIHGGIRANGTPGPLHDLCLRGSKMIVFGGIGATNATLGDIYILDAGTLKWTKGVDGGASVARAYTACAVTNDMFVAWGGCDGALTTLTSNVTIVYNLKTNQWVSGYSPFPYVEPATPTGSAAGTPSGTGAGSVSETGTGSGTGTGAGSWSGGIIGGVVGGLAVIGVVVAVYVFRRRRQVNNDKTTTATSEPVTVDKDNNMYYNSDKVASHTDPNAPPTSDATSSTTPPQFHIFQPSSEAAPIYQLAFIDHHQRNQQQHQQEQQQMQTQNPQERRALKDPQTVVTVSPFPMTSAYATSTSSNPETNNSPSMTKVTSNGNSAELCQSATRNPHTPGDTELFAGVPIPERHPHTTPY